MQVESEGRKGKNLVEFEADDLIYNRFDLIYAENVEKYLYKYENREFAIDAYFENYKAQLNIWGKQFPQSIFESVIDDVFKIHPEVSCIDVKRAKNNYHNLLTEGNDILIRLPETVEQLLERINSKSRYTLRRKKRLCEKECGKLEVTIYNSDIPREIVNLYFDWKQTTHGTDYHMLPEEYLQKYYVTDGILLKAGGRNIGILFFCQVNDTVYLENLSYDVELEKYSPGYLVYEIFLEELIKRKCTYVYLGGGEYTYKKRFGAEENVAYSGTIYRREVFENINAYFQREGIKKIAIYGLGGIGQAFLKVVGQLNICVVYGIDKEKKQVEGMPTCSLEDALEKVDAVIITLKLHNKEVEKFLAPRFEKVYYWIDIASGCFKNIVY